MKLQFQSHYMCIQERSKSRRTDYGASPLLEWEVTRKQELSKAFQNIASLVKHRDVDHIIFVLTLGRP